MTSREKLEIIKNLLKKHNFYNFLNYEFIMDYLKLTRDNYDEKEKYNQKVHVEIRDQVNRLYSWGIVTKETRGLDTLNFSDFTKAKKVTNYVLKELYR